MKKTKVGDLNVYTWEDLKTELTTEDYEDLNNWMKGQTCLKEGIYTWDYERWRNGGRHHLEIESEVLKKTFIK